MDIEYEGFQAIGHWVMENRIRSASLLPLSMPKFAIYPANRSLAQVSSPYNTVVTRNDTKINSPNFEI